MTLPYVTAILNDQTTANRDYEESLSIARRVGDKASMNFIFADWAGMFADQGDYATARSLSEQSYAVSKELGHKVGMCMALGSLSYCARQEGDYTTARSHLAESLVLRRELGDHLQVWGILELIANIDTMQGQEVRAARLLGAVEFFRDELGTAHYAPNEDEHQRLLATIRESLGEVRFAAAWAAGQAMTLDQAIAHALEEDSSG